MKKNVVLILLCMSAAVFAGGNKETESKDAMDDAMNDAMDGGAMMKADDTMAEDSMTEESMAQDTMSDSTMMKADDPMPGEGMATMGGLIEFTTLEKAEAYAENAPAVLFFYADWCPTCKAAIKEFRSMAGDFGDIALYVVNYDTSAALKKRYGVTYQHTFVQVDTHGDSIAMWNGGGMAELKANIVREAMN